MSASTTVKSRIENLIALAQLLERVDADPLAVGAAQYRGLVEQIQTLLRTDLPRRAIDAVLSACPATAIVYENLHYEQAGLSRAPLEQSVASEMAASALIQRARSGAPTGR